MLKVILVALGVAAGGLWMDKCTINMPQQSAPVYGELLR